MFKVSLLQCLLKKYACIANRGPMYQSKSINADAIAPANLVVSRRAVCTGAVAAAACLGTATAAFADDSASDSTGATTDGLNKKQKKVHEQFIATYNVEKQAAIKEKLDKKYAKGTYDEESPLVEVDPFGTNTLSCYVRFATSDAVKVSYKVKASKKNGFAAYEATPRGGNDYATEHEFLVVGLVPGITNTVLLTLTAEDGSERTATIKPEVSKLKGTEETQLKVTQGESNTALADGLYVILGNDSSKLDFMYYYDNDGCIRGEVPLIGYRSHRLLFNDEGMWFSVSTTRMACVSPLGQVLHVFKCGNYELHHDYAFDDDGNLLVLASDLGAEADLDIDRAAGEDEKRQSVEDKVIKIDVATGDVTEVIDMAAFFPKLKKKAKVASDGDLDWIHLNTIQWLGNDTVIVSSRETSTVIKITDIYGTPTIDWMMGNTEFWAGTGFEDKLLAKQGDFSDNGGQHSVTYVTDDSLGEGCYRLLVFDNNFGAAESYPKFDWSQLGAAVVTDYSKGTHSFARWFTVDEQARTYTLDDQITVTFSAYVSSVQQVGGAGSVLVDSGQAKTFVEYDQYGLPITTFKMASEKFIYRVYKYDFAGYYFA